VQWHVHTPHFDPRHKEKEQEDSMASLMCEEGLLLLKGAGRRKMASLMCEEGLLFKGAGRRKMAS
jgi:hypothetical protein